MRLPLEERARIDRERIAFDHLELPRKGLIELGERRDTAPIALDRRHARAGGEQRAGQAARARADLQHLCVFQIARDARDPRQQLRVEEKVLAKRLGGVESVPRDDVAQRWQFGHELAWAARRAAASPAMRIAAIIAPGSARSCPARPNAVP